MLMISQITQPCNRYSSYMIKTANPIPYKEFTLLHQKLTQAELIRGFTYLDC
jgi:hypothetical protein